MCTETEKLNGIENTDNHMKKTQLFESYLLDIE